jgi:hypothetical protein
MEFLFAHRNENFTILELGISQMRLFDEIYGRDVQRTNIGYGDDVTPVDHFGYNVTDSISNSYDSPHYLLLSEPGKGFYSAVYPEYRSLWKFTPEDFKELTMDSELNHIFSDGSVDVFLIVG